MKYIKVDGNPNLYRNSINNSIINNSKSEYDEYLRRKSKSNSSAQKIQTLEQEISIIKNDISDIKNLLIKLIP